LPEESNHETNKRWGWNWNYQLNLKDMLRTLNKKHSMKWKLQPFRTEWTSATNFETAQCRGEYNEIEGDAKYVRNYSC